MLFLKKESLLLIHPGCNLGLPCLSKISKNLLSLHYRDNLEHLNVVPNISHHDS